MRESVFISSCIQNGSYMKLMSFCLLTNIYWSNSKMTPISYDYTLRNTWQINRNNSSQSSPVPVTSHNLEIHCFPYSYSYSEEKYEKTEAQKLPKAGIYACLPDTGLVILSRHLFRSVYCLIIGSISFNITRYKLSPYYFWQSWPIKYRLW